MKLKVRTLPQCDVNGQSMVSERSDDTKIQEAPFEAAARLNISDKRQRVLNLDAVLYRPNPPCI
jgi:hypothetical protein